MRPARPTAIAANGSAHHQCSEKAEKPWLLSRPDTKRPRTTKSAATAWAERLIYQERSVANRLAPRGLAAAAAAVLSKVSGDDATTLTGSCLRPRPSASHERRLVLLLERFESQEKVRRGSESERIGKGNENGRGASVEAQPLTAYDPTGPSLAPKGVGGI